MFKKPNEYIWNEGMGLAECKVYYKDLVFCGDAWCHPEDEDMKSKLTGLTIAEIRATIQVLQHIKNNEVRPQLDVLLQLYNTMKNSKRFNKKSYEMSMIFRRINALKNELDATKKEIAILSKNLRDYIAKKENDHQVIRAKRLLAENK